MTNKRIPLDFNNYPSLWKLFREDKERFAALVQTTLRTLDSSVKRGDLEVSDKSFNMPYEDLLLSLIDAMFEYEGIINNHKNEAEREAMKGLAHDINPIAVLTGNAYALDTKGNHVPADQWSSTQDIKSYIQSVLYGARFVPLADLAEYLTVGEYELVDVLKARNFDSLASIQNTLRWQEQRGIVKGKLIDGLGLFDGGEIEEMERCPICREHELKEFLEIHTCKACKVGFNVVKLS